MLHLRREYADGDNGYRTEYWLMRGPLAKGWPLHVP